MSSARRVLVVGAGIAGLATARALRPHGIECDVIERAQGWSHPGAGMYLPANAVRALSALGLHDAFLDRSCTISRQRFFDHRGRALLDVDLPAFWGATWPCAAISHGALHEILREGVEVRLGTSAISLDEDGPVVRAVFDDGSSGDYDLVVGADGVRSWVRSAMFGGTEPRFVGQLSWRFLLAGFPELSSWTVRLGRGKAFLTIPLGDGRIYCYADIDTSDRTDPTGGDPGRFRDLYGEFADPVPTIVNECVATAVRRHFSPIEEVVQEPWVRGRVVLIGDAAHAMSPNMAEGAGMALEDALVLAETVAAGEPLETFEARRRPRVTFVQRQTHRRDRTRHLPPVLRNTTLRLAGRRIFQSNYKPLLAEP
jgi:FAD-dependent urate hydroxylase